MYPTKTRVQLEKLVLVPTARSHRQADYSSGLERHSHYLLFADFDVALVLCSSEINMDEHDSVSPIDSNWKEIFLTICVDAQN